MLYPILIIIAGLSYGLYQWNSQRNLDRFYLEQLQTVKSRMIHGSNTESQEQLGQYQDHIEMEMHMDGYTGPEIMKIRCEAFQKAVLEEKTNCVPRN